MLMEAMFTDNGLPDLLIKQREFHAEIMTGFMTEHEQLLKGVLKNKKTEKREKMRLQSRLPNMEMMDKGFKSHNPIKGANIVQSLNPLQAKMLEKSKTMIVEDP
jgi:hypothetical protein